MAVAEGAAALVARRLGCDGSPELLRAGDNFVFRAGDAVLRVARAGVDVSGQVALARWLSDQGVPVLCPIGDPIEIDDVTVTVWDFIDSGMPIDYRQLGNAIATLHQLEPDSLPAHIALPWFAAASWLDLDTNLETASEAGVVRADDISLLRAAAAELAGWQEDARDHELVVCHGDVHPQNVLMRGGELVVIDWDNICLGPVAWDHAALLTWAERWGGASGVYDAFAVGYGIDLRTSSLAQTLARVRLLAPTINMIVMGAQSASHAAEAQVRMRYWRGEPSPPKWAPQ